MSECCNPNKDVQDGVKRYYGEILTGTSDLNTNACCTAQSPPAEIAAILKQIHPEVSSHYYGCGLVVPEALNGCHILDLGSGSGQDCFVLSELVGEQGSVTGVDMTPEQLAIAERHIEFHRQQFGQPQTRVKFYQGQLEALDKLPLQEHSFDVIVSNCVINLCADKLAVLRQARRLLKPGGELYFSDVYADRRVPGILREDEVLYGECLSGALYWNDFIELARQAGFIDPRRVSAQTITIDNPELQRKTGEIHFFSATCRLFAIDELEPNCEDYGQAVIYQGTISEHPDFLELDEHHRMDTGRCFPVCGNTWKMLAQSRLAPHFQFIGNFDHHYGVFPGCGQNLPLEQQTDNQGAGCCQT